MRIFYASGHWYEPGEVIHPGSWGRVVQGAGSSHSWFGYEMFVELIRLTEFPEAPSRLRSLMASASLDVARYWLQPPRRHLYELEVDEKPFAVSVGWIDRWFSDVHDVASAQECVRSYWTGSPCPGDAPVELLVTQPATVAARH